MTAITICFYDWFVVFNDEVELLGSTRFSKGKILYYFVGPVPYDLTLDNACSNDIPVVQTRIVTPIGLILGVFRGCHSDLR